MKVNRKLLVVLALVLAMLATTLTAAADGPADYKVEGMTPASDETLSKEVTNRDGSTYTGFSMTGYNRKSTAADGSAYMWDQGDTYLGYSIVDGQLKAGESNLGEAAVESGRYSIDLNMNLDGEKFTAVYLLGDKSEADISGYMKVTGDEVASVYYNEDGTLVTDNSDMSGTGSAIVVANGGKAYVKDLYYVSEGFDRDLAVAWGDGEHSTILDVRDSEFYTLAADPVSETPDGFLLGGLDFNTMMSPPWVLGLYGGTRSVNILNNKATFNMINSTVGGAGWAILSSDSCSDPVFNVVDSKIIALTSDDGFEVESDGFSYGGFDILQYDGYTVDGVHHDYGVAYGTYAIGSSREFFYGVDVFGPTYAVICTTGDFTNFYSSNGKIDLYDAMDYDAASDSFTKAYDSVQGKGANSRIYSVFGFMSHGDGDIGVYEGTEVYTEDAAFLYKNGNVVYTVDDSTVAAKNGVLLQMIDNDDAQAGGPMAQYLVGQKGLPTKVYEADEEGKTVDFVLSNGEYAGNLFNATGWYHSETWGQVADTLNVSIDNAKLAGAITSTKEVHAVAYYKGIEEDIAAQSARNLSYGYTEIEYCYLDAALEVVSDASKAAYVQFVNTGKLQYWVLGHVINTATAEGGAIVNVELSNGSAWKANGVSYLDSLTVGAGSSIEGYVYVNGKAVTPEAGKTYTGNIVVSSAPVEAAMSPQTGIAVAIVAVLGLTAAPVAVIAGRKAKKD